MSFLGKVLSAVIYRDEATNDHLEAYPERYHVEALPERRYLKTARFWVVASLISIAFNFAMCFIYMRNASLVQAIVEVPNNQDTFLYNKDLYNKELKPVEKPVRVLFMEDLLYQNLISDYLTERFQITANRAEMQKRWSEKGKVYAYAPKLFDAFKENEAKEGLSRLEKGLTQEIYIYSVKRVNFDFYEVVFDVFVLNESGYGKQKCPCYEKSKECLTCMRETAVGEIKRKKAYMRGSIGTQDLDDAEISAVINPYYFIISELYILDQSINEGNVFEDVDEILQ